MIPVCLVTGFLGSGKTTLLQRIVETNRHRRIVYIVNEFSTADVDGKRLALPEGGMVSIPGGSIFCRCLAGEFVRALQEASKVFEPGAEKPEGVVIEASGIADPNVASRMFRETMLDRIYELRSVISVVDPGSFQKLIHTLPNIVRQVEGSNLILINKSDVYSDELLQEMESRVREIQPRAVVMRTEFCRMDFDPFQAAGRVETQGEYALCADPNYAQTAVRVRNPVDWAGVRDAIDLLGDDVYRVKGAVRTAAELKSVDYSSSGWREDALPDTGKPYPPELVFIVRGDAGDAVKDLRARIERGEFDPRRPIARTVYYPLAGLRFRDVSCVRLDFPDGLGDLLHLDPFAEQLVLCKPDSGFIA